MINVGDTVVFRYMDDPYSNTTPNEWYDFKDEVDYLYSSNYDLETWQTVFNQKGIVTKIKHNVITVVVDGVGEVEGNSKIIKLLVRSKPTFKIKRNLEYVKV